MFTEALPFIQLYIDSLNRSLADLNGRELTRLQMMWLGFCLTAMILTNSVCWKAWERWSGGKYTDGALSWMFRKSQISWNNLLTASLRLILKKYNIKKGVLVIDDSDHQRSKKTKKIGYVHRIKDKKNEGYFNGQNLVFLCLVTDTVTIPCGFLFYQPRCSSFLKKRTQNLYRTLCTVSSGLQKYISKPTMAHMLFGRRFRYHMFR
jgi:hypothetical protein